MDANKIDKKREISNTNKWVDFTKSDINLKYIWYESLCIFKSIYVYMMICFLYTHRIEQGDGIINI